LSSSRRAEYGDCSGVCLRGERIQAYPHDAGNNEHGAQATLSILGAELVLTEGAKGMKGAIRKGGRNWQLFIKTISSPQQFKNPANPEIHAGTRQKRYGMIRTGKLIILSAGVGTGRNDYRCRRGIEKEKAFR